MELTLLDSLLRRSAVIDNFESLIWTERYSTAGDIELVIDSDVPTRNLLRNGELLSLDKSNRVMQIESIEQKNDSDGRTLFTIKGPSIEDLLDDRGSRPAESMLAVYAPNTDATWRFTDTPGNIARAVFQAICVTGVVSAADIFPFIASGNLYPADTIAEPSTTITVDIDLASSVYTVVTNLCASYDLGFRITRNGDNGQVFFNVYSGSDRTTQQTTLPPVIFGQDFGNLTDITQLTTQAGFKNVADVIAPHGRMYVYGRGADGTLSGFDRRVMLVDASDITLTAGAALTAALTQKGLEALAQTKSLQALDGEVSENTPFVYGVDYNLGDLVEMRNSTGATSSMRVTEQIFASDAAGERSYPTLSAEVFVAPGSWYSSTGAHIWNDMTGSWDSL